MPAASQTRVGIRPSRGAPQASSDTALIVDDEDERPLYRTWLCRLIQWTSPILTSKPVLRGFCCRGRWTGTIHQHWIVPSNCCVPR
jgi:hypothetical protein